MAYDGKVDCLGAKEKFILVVEDCSAISRYSNPKTGHHLRVKCQERAQTEEDRFGKWKEGWVDDRWEGSRRHTMAMELKSFRRKMVSW